MDLQQPQHQVSEARKSNDNAHPFPLLPEVTTKLCFEKDVRLSIGVCYCRGMPLKPQTPLAL